MPSKTHIHHHNVWLKRLKKKRLKGLWGVYLNSMLRNMGMSLVGIFIPIYIYKVTGGFMSLFVFYFLYHLFVLLSSPLAAGVMKQMGVDKTAVIGAILRASFLYLMILAGRNAFWLWPAAMIWGVTVTFSWLPYHYTVIAEDDGDGLFGKEVAHLIIVEKLVSAAAPFIGGLIIYFQGFKLLYWSGLAFVAVSAVPMLMDGFDKKEMRLDIFRVFREVIAQKHRAVNLSLVGSLLESQIFGIMRPLLIFLVLGSAAKLGGIESVAVLLSVLVAWWAGNRVDKKGFGIMKIGVVANALGLLLFPFLSETWEFLLLNSIYLVVSVLIWTPFGAAIYELASRERRLEFFVRREIVLHAAAAALHLFLLGLFAFKVIWLPVFGIGSLGLLLSLFLLKGVKDGSVNQRPQIHPAAA